MKYLYIIITLLLGTQISYSQRKYYQREKKFEKHFRAQNKTIDSLNIINKRGLSDKEINSNKLEFIQSQKLGKRKTDSILKNSSRIEENPFLAINPKKNSRLKEKSTPPKND